MLHRALAQAVRWDWIWLNPASAASPPRVVPPEVRPPTPGQVAVLLEWAKREDPPLFCYLRLAVSANIIGPDPADQSAGSVTDAGSLEPIAFVATTLKV